MYLPIGIGGETEVSVNDSKPEKDRHVIQGGQTPEEAHYTSKIYSQARIPISTGEPTEEMVDMIEANGGANQIEGWLAVPRLYPNTKERRRKEQVDAYALMEDLLDSSQLVGTLRTIDVLNGCMHHCGTCLADAALPSKLFSLDSLKKLFSDKRFIDQLQPDSLRIGSSGDILDHPDAIKIIQLILEFTAAIDQQRQKEGTRHQVKVFTK